MKRYVWYILEIYGNILVYLPGLVFGGDCWVMVLHRTQVPRFCSGNSNQDVYYMYGVQERSSECHNAMAEQVADRDLHVEPFGASSWLVPYD